MQALNNTNMKPSFKNISTLANNIFKKKILQLTGLVLCFIVLVFAFTLGMLAILTVAAGASGFDGFILSLFANPLILILFGLTYVVLSLWVSGFTMACYLYVLNKGAKNEKSNIFSAMHFGLKKSFQLLWTQFVFILPILLLSIMLVIFSMFAGFGGGYGTGLSAIVTILAIILYAIIGFVYFGFCCIITVDQKMYGLSALRQSSKLVKNKFWYTFFIFFLFFLINAIPQIFINLMSSNPNLGIFPFIIVAVIIYLISAYTGAIYVAMYHEYKNNLLNQNAI